MDILVGSLVCTFGNAVKLLVDSCTCNSIICNIHCFLETTRQAFWFSCRAFVHAWAGAVGSCEIAAVGKAEYDGAR